jgi:hypothetical protein
VTVDTFAKLTDEERAECMWIYQQGAFDAILRFEIEATQLRSAHEILGRLRARITQMERMSTRLRRQDRGIA